MAQCRGGVDQKDEAWLNSGGLDQKDEAWLNSGGVDQKDEAWLNSGGLDQKDEAWLNRGGVAQWLALLPAVRQARARFPPGTPLLSQLAYNNYASSQLSQIVKIVTIVHSQ